MSFLEVSDLTGLLFHSYSR